MTNPFPQTDTLDSVPALSILEGLARLHQTVLALDARGRTVWSSDQLGVLCGRALRSNGARDPSPFAAPDHLRRIGKLMRDQGRVAHERLELRGEDGQFTPVEVSGLRVSTGAQEEPLYVFIIRSLADKERTDRELRRTLEHMRAVLEQSPEPVLALDRHGFITYGNAALGRLLGQETQDALGKPFSCFVRDAESLERVTSTFRPGGEAHGLEIQFGQSDVGAARVSLSASELKDPAGVASGWVLILHDVTERRRCEHELEQKNAELEHYVHAVSHDLRSPLVSLLGFSKLLRQEYGERLDQTGRHFLDRLEQASHRMEALINDLLELSRVGEPSERRVAIDLQVLLRHLRAELKPRLESENVELVLPECAGVVQGDRTRLYQVFSNLIENALDHMGPCEDPRITVEIVEEPETVRLSVRDNGRGIDPKNHERVFEIFQSLGPRVDGRRGTGIGLAIVKKSIENQGGRVWLESRPGEGAAFHLTLPGADPPEALREQRSLAVHPSIT